MIDVGMEGWMGGRRGLECVLSLSMRALVDGDSVLDSSLTSKHPLFLFPALFHLVELASHGGIAGKM